MNSRKSPHCSVVIRCYNEQSHIAQLLEGIVQQTVLDVEIILVDSGSTDATLEIASQYPVRILHIKPKEFSFGRSLNMGCQVARGEYIAIASAHVYPLYRDWLERLLTPFTAANIALVYGRQCGNERTKYSERQTMKKWFPEAPLTGQDNPFCNNANAAIRRSVWEQVRYDETLTGLEDMDWARRVMQHGYTIAYAADAEVVHVHDESWGRIYNRYRREAIAYKRIFPGELFTFRDFIRLSAGNIASDYYHAFRDGQFWRNFVGIPMFRLMQFWGAFRGFAHRGEVLDDLKARFYYPNGLSRDSERLGSDNVPRAKVRYGSSDEGRR